VEILDELAHIALWASQQGDPRGCEGEDEEETVNALLAR
jgi:hypothetical protein